MLDEIKVLQDEIGERKEAVKRGDVEEVPAPEHEVDEFEECPPMEELPKELLGRYQKVGNCKCCEATVYIEEYGAMKVTRPRLIYTCAEWCMAGYDDRDVKWSPTLFAVPDLSQLPSEIDESSKEIL